MEDFQYIIRSASLKNSVITALNEKFIVSDLLNSLDFVVDHLQYSVCSKMVSKDVFVIFSVLRTDKSNIINQREGDEQGSILNLMQGNDVIFRFSFSYRKNHSFQLLFDIIDLMNGIITEEGCQSEIIVEDSHSGLFMPFDIFYNHWIKKKGFFFYE